MTGDVIPLVFLVASVAFTLGVVVGACITQRLYERRTSPVTGEIAALRQEVADLGAAQTAAFDKIAATDSRLADLATPGTPRIM